MSKDEQSFTDEIATISAEQLGDLDAAAFEVLEQEDPERFAELIGSWVQHGHEPSDVGSHTLPVVAVVGRPNVGKSTLVNRILGRRAAVVQDVPGVTRDRVRYEANWAGKDFILIDTGGWQGSDRGTDTPGGLTRGEVSQQISSQAERAITEADVVMFVVDATVGETDADAAMAKVLRRARIPVILVANKVDDPRTELEAAALWSLGLGEPYPVSGLHGRGSGDLLDVVLEAMPEQGRGEARGDGPARVALLGKPNVGKSSLLNKLAGEDRVVVDSVAGTTVDPVDEVVELGGKQWIFVDTAGIRRRSHQAHGHEYYATLRTRQAVERADVVALLIDTTEPLAEQDQRMIALVVETGRALVLVFNKWDLLDEDRRDQLEREIDRDLGQVRWAPRVNVSAQTGRAVEKLVPALEAALDGWSTRISTGKLNTFISELTAAHPHPVRSGKQPRILFGTQVDVCPPTFVLFTTGFLEAGYRRFIERRLREEFGFVGSPIRLSLRVRSKRRK